MIVEIHGKIARDRQSIYRLRVTAKDGSFTVGLWAGDRKRTGDIAFMLTGQPVDTLTAYLLCRSLPPPSSGGRYELPDVDVP